MLSLKIVSDPHAKRKRVLLRQNHLTLDHEVSQTDSFQLLRVARIVLLSEVC